VSIAAVQQFGKDFTQEGEPAPVAVELLQHIDAVDLEAIVVLFV
jgi:hypothetical protein